MEAEGAPGEVGVPHAEERDRGERPLRKKEGAEEGEQQGQQLREEEEEEGEPGALEEEVGVERMNGLKRRSRTKKAAKEEEEGGGLKETAPGPRG